MEKEVNFQVKLQGASMQMSVSVRAGATGADLLEAIKRSIGGHEIVGGEMKVLSAGKRVAPDTSVASLRNSSPLLVLGVKPAQLQSSPPKTTESFSLLSSSPDARNAADRAIEMENAKMDKLSEAALEFAKQNGADGDYHAEVVDQNGKRMALPESDRRNLVAAQVLHEHGRKLMKNQRFEDAIRVLTDSTKLFLKVSPALLKIIDNYGLACLDLSWSFLKLGNIKFLDTAREHLNSAQFALELAHGPNMERLMQVRGDDHIIQKTLYVRLAVLRGVVAVHRGENISAQSYFAHAEDLLHELRIEDFEIEPLIAMGFSKSEARRGMRLSRKDIQGAVMAITNRRDELEQQAKDRRRQRRQDRLGKTANGQAVDLEMFDQLVAMGFEDRMAANALRQTNNDLGAATELMTTQPNLLANSDDGRRVRRALLAQLESMGFLDRNAAKAALKACHGNVEEAASLLLAQSDSAAAESAGGAFDPMDDEDDDPFDVPPQQPLPPAETEEERLARERDVEVRDAAKNDLVNALAEATRDDNDDEFDLNLEDEFMVLLQYKTKS